ncbi:radical SAM protein [candidate division GN15 bacterium]|nr:radical SAM protein [candidate division GN15 bacterium]
MSLIDYRQLEEAYNNDRIYSLQLEVGDVCCQACNYCYMNALETPSNQLTDTLIARIIDDAARLGITAVEWLGGEPLLRPGVFRLMAQAAERNLRNNIWTGGLPLASEHVRRECMSVAQDGLISVHVSSIDPKMYVRLHPGRPVEDLDTILQGVRALLLAGYPAEQILNSVTYTGLQSAKDMIATIDLFEDRFGIKTSLNVYHTYLRPGQTDRDLARFIPSPDQVARVYSRYKRQHGIAQVPMNCVDKQYCSATVAVLADGTVTPCATIRESGAPRVTETRGLFDIFQKHRDHLIFKQFKDPANLPDRCRVCGLSSECWGCRSRAYAAGEGIYGDDPRCFRRATKPTERQMPKPQANK